jgi:tRNA-uridine 2-sulfurtransferase
MTKKNARGIGILSGGLDSLLAVKVLQDQDLDLLGIVYTTPFFGLKAGTRLDLVLGIPVHTVDLTQKHLEMLRNPVYGFGQHLNPCIDCHALMLREAGRIMDEVGGDFLFTGEVLWQRPMSQRRDSLRSVEKLSGYPGRVLRPLSAKLLEPTIPEIEGLIDRSRLLDISGRGRKRQMALADHYGIRDYPQPGGGCLLTKEGFARKLKLLLECYPDSGQREIELLKWGRHFRLSPTTILIVGRNQQDNERIEDLAGPGDTLLRAADVPGPTGLILVHGADDDALALAVRILISYSDTPPGKEAQVVWKRASGTGRLNTHHTEREVFKDLLVG